MSSPPPEKRRRPILVPVLCVLLVVAVSGWAREVARSPELVDVVIARKELESLSVFTDKNIDECTTTKRLPKDALRDHFISNKQDLIGKQLVRPIHQGMYFRRPNLRVYSPGCWFGGDERDTYTLEFPWAAGVVADGRVDVLGCAFEGKRARVLTLLPDVHVLAVDPPKPQTGIPGPIMASLSVKEEEVKLLLLARARGMKLELLWRLPETSLRYPTPDLREHARKAAFDILAHWGEEPEPELPLAPKPQDKPIP